MEDEFKAWLLSHHYRLTTVKDTVRAIDRVATTFEETGEVPSDRNAKTAIARWLAFKAERRETRGALYEACLGAGTVPLAPDRLPKEKPARRKLEARSFEETNWVTLTNAVQGSSDRRDQVLWAISTTGLRIGDVLRVDLGTLQSGLSTGELQLERKGGTFIPVPLGIPEPWQALYDGMTHTEGGLSPRNVAEYVAPGFPNPEADGAAYKRVARRFKAIGRKHSLPGRVHLHRLRRTVAVNALNATGDIVAVKDMLGQKSVNTTMRYVDEARSGKVKELQRHLAGVGRRT